MRLAVVGHTEWIEFGRVDRVPGPGEIAHASQAWQEAGGGGAVAAVQLSRLGGDCDLFTALGDDPAGTAARRRLTTLGARVHAEPRRGVSTRRAVTLVDGDGERTITTLGERLDPLAAEPLPWELLDETDAVYVTAGDVAAFRHARRARVMVVTLRALARLADSGIEADCLVGSARDPGERWEVGALRGPPPLLVRTEGAQGGSFQTAAGQMGRYVAEPPPGPTVDTYGAGDTFAAALTFSLGVGMAVDDALAFAAGCGAVCVSGRGPFGARIA
ncbi:MAG: PfkB family carbohydrate kinase [Actinomycetota bacterium]